MTLNNQPKGTNIMAKTANPKSNTPLTLTVTESDTPIVSKRTAAPNPLHEHVLVAEQNRGKAYQVPFSDPEQAKLITSLLRRSGNELDVTVRINQDDTAQVIRFAVKDGERVRRPRVA